MTREVAYHPAAAAEVLSAVRWYEGERAGLGDRFLTAVDAAVTRASRSPSSGRPVVVADDGMIVNRKMPVRGFPWAIGYEVVGDDVLVLAVFHQHRRPDYWTERT